MGTGKGQAPGFVIAIDGPAGSGKSTTARLCARQLGFFYLDTGAMYRAVTLKVLRAGIDWRDERALGRLLRDTRLELKESEDGLRVFLDGEDVTREIRSPKVNQLVSPISALAVVRKMMVAEQRRLARGRNVVCEGRDIGSVVFPGAQLKVFLDCDIAERARRRSAELKEKGLAQGLSDNAVRRNLLERDKVDSSRRLSPLRRVPDAVLVDTTHLTIDEQVAVVCALARQRMQGDK